jgi:hypothetical protein
MEILSSWVGFREMDGAEVRAGAKRKEREVEGPAAAAVGRGRDDDAAQAKKARADVMSSTNTTTTSLTSRGPTKTERRRDGAPAHGGEEHATATATALLLQTERKIERETLRTIDKIVTRYHCALCRTLALQIGAPPCPPLIFLLHFLFTFNFFNKMYFIDFYYDFNK